MDTWASVGAATAGGDPNMAEMHQNLGLFYTNRYRTSGDLEDLKAALKYNLSSVTGTPAGYPDLPGRQQGLAVSYTYMYRRTGDLEDLGAALTYNQLAASGIPQGHPNVPALDLMSLETYS